MTDQDTRYRGRDFLIGFIPSAIVAGVATAMMSIDDGIAPLLWAGAGLGVAAMVATHAQRWHIAIGIVTVLAAFPLLLIGACFSAFSWS